MPHVFVETNWLVDCCAPAHNRVPAALDLLRRAAAGEIQLCLPAICLAEARHPLQTKFQTRLEADRVRRYVTWALGDGRLEQAAAETVRNTIQQMENTVQTDLRAVPERLREIAQAPGVALVPYDADMMNRAFEYSIDLPDIKPYDQAILSTVTVHAERLIQQGNRELYFSERDSDLQPWDKNGDPVERLVEVYDNCNVWVCSDYLLEHPAMPEGWHDREP